MIKTKNILIVDEDLDIIQMIHKILQEINEDYGVLATNSPLSAMKIAEENQPDIIITDWHMPEMSGIELINALKSNLKTKDIPVIMTTGISLTTENLNTALNAGAVDYILKPINRVELQARVNSAFLLSLKHKKDLEIKDTELTESTLDLMRRNEFLKTVKNQLTQLKETTSMLESYINNLNSEINLHIKSNGGNRFETSFHTLNPEFSKKMLKQYPELSPKEIKLSSLLMLGMSSKDIASVSSISENSVKVSRYRLRKKLDLPEKENLQNFLTSL